MRVYNFSAGPSMLFEDVLKEAQASFLDYENSGMSVTEMSHRAKVYDGIHNECLALFTELMKVPEDYQVLLLQGGASQQFDAIPLNLISATGKADYVVTGNFANLAYKQAKKYGDIALAASSEDKTFTYIPKVTVDSFRKDASYVHITSNNTIFGTRWKEFPETPCPLVADVSSEILSRDIDVSKFGILYAGAQKNISAAGLTVVIIRKDLIGKELPICPTMLAYKTQADKNSLYNTPPAFSIYIAMLTLRHIKKMGGISVINEINESKAAMLYDFIDNSSLYKNYVNKEDRSIMNVPFVTGSEELDAKFVKEAAANGLVSIKGHRLVGGMRASIYNAMPVEGVKKLIEFMKKFELENK